MSEQEIIRDIKIKTLMALIQLDVQVLEQTQLQILISDLQSLLKPRLKTSLNDSSSAATAPGMPH